MEFSNEGCGLPGLNTLLKKLLESRTTAIDEAATFKAYIIFSCFVFYSVIFAHKLRVIKKEYIIWLQIYSAAILPNSIKIGRHLTE